MPSFPRLTPWEGQLPRRRKLAYTSREDTSLVCTSICSLSRTLRFALIRTMSTTANISCRLHNALLQRAGRTFTVNVSKSAIRRPSRRSEGLLRPVLPRAFQLPSWYQAAWWPSTSTNGALVEVGCPAMPNRVNSARCPGLKSYVKLNNAGKVFLVVMIMLYHVRGILFVIVAGGFCFWAWQSAMQVRPFHAAKLRLVVAEQIVLIFRFALKTRIFFLSAGTYGYYHKCDKVCLAAFSRCVLSLFVCLTDKLQGTYVTHMNALQLGYLRCVFRSTLHKSRQSDHN
jgi:hypothetical protein